MGNRKDLKAFIRLDSSGKVVPGSLVFRKKQPAGRFKELKDPAAYGCCSLIDVNFTLCFTIIESQFYLSLTSDRLLDENAFFRVTALDDNGDDYTFDMLIEAGDDSVSTSPVSFTSTGTAILSAVINLAVPTQSSTQNYLISSLNFTGEC